MTDEGSWKATTRRRVLLGAGVGATVALAGCSSGTADGADNVPVRGDPEADVTLEVYEDLGCPACQSYTQNVFPSIRSRYLDTGRIRYEHRDFIVKGPPARQAANAAREVLEQGGDAAFWAFTKAVFDNQNRLQTEAPGLFSELAGNVGVDEPSAVADAGRNLTHDSAVGADIDRGESLGVESTPSFVIDGSTVSGNNLGPEIDQALSEQ
jgi:protein-disulfide isomerase